MSCITLLSDFGLQDASVAAAKGVLMQHASGLQIVDISHLVEQYHLQQAAFLLLASYRKFPAGTCHVLLFDVFYDSNSRLMVCQKDGHYFLAPDNGLLSLAFGSSIKQVWCGYEMTDQDTFRDWLEHAGEIINHIKTGGIKSAGLEPSALQVAPLHWQPKIFDNTVECHVIHIDRFGNVVLNITKDQFQEIGQDRPFRVLFMRDEEITKISTHYYNVSKGEKLCRFNSTGYLEIAINRGNAASLLGLRLYREMDLMYKTIKIYFE